jgi:uncharacterized protein (TIGR00299 family) protein
MRTLHFDCFAGASGDMILGALVAVGVDRNRLREELARLNVHNYEIDFSMVDRSGISATRAQVRTGDEHAHRYLSDILKIIYESGLSDSVKERAARIFSRLAEAEARVHNVSVERIHFHEVGALDAIIDVVGTCLGFELLGIERFTSSALHVGSGTVEMAHGRFPVPPPAVAELLKDAPIYSTDIVGELVTPTGAAIISTVCESYGSLPKMRIEGAGYGAGARQYQNFPNVLRLMLGESAVKSEKGVRTQDKKVARAMNESFAFADGDENLLMIETNIDDMSSQLFGYLMEQAFAQGAFDCYFTPVQMKKNRPGTLVSILCRPEDKEQLIALLFSETTTLGVRSFEVRRRALARETVRVETLYGAVDVKVARASDGCVIKIMPEYDQCRALAQRANVALRVVEEEAHAAFKSSQEDGVK